MAEESFQIGGGGFRGPSPTPLGSGVARTLGQQGGELPSLAANPGVVQPVFIIGDTSQSLSRALAVRRGWAAARQVVGAANVFKFGIRGYASAGIVIEQLRIVGVAPAVLAAQFNVGIPFPAAVFPGYAIGGTPTNEFIGGATQGALFGQGVPVGPVIFSPHAALFAPLPFSIFVPPGEGFTFETGDLGVDVDWSIVWREVPE